MLETIDDRQDRRASPRRGNSFDLMARTPSNVGGMFNAAMADLTRFCDAGCAGAYDFGRIASPMDVEAAPANLSGPWQKYPHIRELFFDLPRCEDAATRHLERAGVGDRTEFHGWRFLRGRSKPR